MNLYGSDMDETVTPFESGIGWSVALEPGDRVLVIDDGSPDGTGTIANELADNDEQIHVLHRTEKAGLGAAYLHGFGWALEQGYDVVGVTLRVWPWEDADEPTRRFGSCCSPETVEDARQVARALGIPHYLLNTAREFDNTVIENFAAEYRERVFATCTDVQRTGVQGQRSQD